MTEHSGVLSPTDTSTPSEVPAPKSYANVVDSHSSLSKFDVSVSVVDGKSTVTVPDEIFVDSPPLWEDFLVGRFPSETKAPHVAKIHVIVNKIWNLGDKNIKIDVFAVNDTTVKFRIRHVSARLRVLRRGMWNICNLPMTVSKWSPFPEEAQPELKTMHMWVVVKNVPHSMFTWKGLSLLTSPVGHPKRLHRETELVTNFDEAKVFVEVDLMKDLPKTYYFKVQGDEVCVNYEYPWLPPRCDACRKWGHIATGCLVSLGKTQSSLRNSKCSDVVEVAGSSSSPAAKENNPVVKTNHPVSIEAELPVNLAEDTIETEEVAGPTSSPVEKENNPVVKENHPVLIEAAVQENLEEDTIEKEEGEIPTTPVSTATGQEDEWQNVPSGGKTSKNSGKSLAYGEVQIASPTIYDVLRDNDAEGDGLFSTVASTDPPADISNKLTSDSDKSQPTRQSRAGITIRSQPPRNTKSTHKFLSDSAQKGKDAAPSNIGKRNHPKAF